MSEEEVPPELEEEELVEELVVVLWYAPRSAPHSGLGFPLKSVLPDRVHPPAPIAGLPACSVKFADKEEGVKCSK